MAVLLIWVWTEEYEDEAAVDDGVVLELGTGVLTREVDPGTVKCVPDVCPRGGSSDDELLLLPMWLWLGGRRDVVVALSSRGSSALAVCLLAPEPWSFPDAAFLMFCHDKSRASGMTAVQKQVRCYQRV